MSSFTNRDWNSVVASPPPTVPAVAKAMSSSSTTRPSLQLPPRQSPVPTTSVPCRYTKTEMLSMFLATDRPPAMYEFRLPIVSNDCQAPVNSEPPCETEREIFESGSWYLPGVRSSAGLPPAKHGRVSVARPSRLASFSRSLSVDDTPLPSAESRPARFNWRHDSHNGPGSSEADTPSQHDSRRSSWVSTRGDLQGTDKASMSRSATIGRSDAALSWRRRTDSGGEDDAVSSTSQSGLVADRPDIDSHATPAAVRAGATSDASFWRSPTVQSRRQTETEHQTLDSPPSSVPISSNQQSSQPRMLSLSPPSPASSIGPESRRSESPTEGLTERMASLDRSFSRDSWWYQDPQGNVHGPFSCEEMRDWYHQNYFQLTLPVRCHRDQPFNPLGSLFLKGDPAFLDHVPVVMAAPARPMNGRVMHNSPGIALPSQLPPPPTPPLQQQQQQQQHPLHRLQHHLLPQAHHSMMQPHMPPPSSYYPHSFAVPSHHDSMFRSPMSFGQSQVPSPSVLGPATESWVSRPYSVSPQNPDVVGPTSAPILRASWAPFANATVHPPIPHAPSVDNTSSQLRSHRVPEPSPTPLPIAQSNLDPVHVEPDAFEAVKNEPGIVSTSESHSEHVADSHHPGATETVAEDLDSMPFQIVETKRSKKRQSERKLGRQAASEPIERADVAVLSFTAVKPHARAASSSEAAPVGEPAVPTRRPLHDWFETTATKSAPAAKCLSEIQREEEMMDRKREQALAAEREAELRCQQEASAAGSTNPLSAWSAANYPPAPQSLLEIQKQEEILQKSKPVQRPTASAWAAKTAAASTWMAPPKPASLSMRQIQEEEQRVLRQQMTPQAHYSSLTGWSAAVAGSTWPRPATITAASACNQALATAAPKSKVEQRLNSPTSDSDEDEPFWNNEMPKQKQQQQVRARQQSQSESASSNEFGGPALSPAFHQWCKEKLAEISTDCDVSLAEFLITLKSSEAVREYIYEYLGRSAKVEEFAGGFLQHKEFDEAKLVVKSKSRADDHDNDVEGQGDAQDGGSSKKKKNRRRRKKKGESSSFQ